MALHTGQQTYISLYTGGGGLDLGFRLANPDAVPLLYVERELPAAALMVDHIEAGLLDAAPVWADTGTLDCKPFADKVDWIIGGFPCQPFSVAGKQRGTEDQRWLWEHIRRLAVEIRPRYLFLENTPGLLVHSGIGTILGDLSEIGFNDVEWTSVRASDVGAPHRRERVFILAYSSRVGGKRGPHRQTERGRGGRVRLSSKQLAHTGHDARRSEQEQQHTVETAGVGQSSTALAHPDNPRSPAPGSGVNGDRATEGKGREGQPQPKPRGSGKHMGNASVEGRQGKNSIRQPKRFTKGRSELGNASVGRDQDRNTQPSRAVTEQRSSYVVDTISQRGRGWHTGGEYAEHAFPPGPSASAEWQDILSRRPDLAPAVGKSAEQGLPKRNRERVSATGTRDAEFECTGGRNRQATAEPEVRGVADGVARGLARATQLRILGNGVVPQQAALAFHILKERITNGSTSTSKQH